MEGRGGERSREGESDLFFLAEMEIDKLMAERRVAASEQDRTGQHSGT